jgi:hypothetical protein
LCRNVMRQAIEREVEREETRKLAIMLINEGYRALAKKAHPDAGGSHATMARLSTLRDALLANHKMPRLPRWLRNEVQRRDR